jgi:hypothetical protein
VTKNGKHLAEKRAAKTRGAAWAQQTRQRCNPLTEAGREKLLDRAMQIAYGPQAEPAAARRR